ncbi:hypothetical protein TNCV_3356751 [Trichonephila clavipes]|nr:hypothetical protein TNCV_3356751 [Trichonephila clavipes]
MLRLKHPPVGVVWKFGEGVPAQVSSSSLDHGSNQLEGVRIPVPGLKVLFGGCTRTLPITSFGVHEVLIDVPKGLKEIKGTDGEESDDFHHSGWVKGRRIDEFNEMLWD